MKLGDAPVSRIFGGHIASRGDAPALAEAFKRILPAIREVAEDAEKLGGGLPLENHWGLPCTGEEQVKVRISRKSSLRREAGFLGDFRRALSARVMWIISSV